MSAIIPNNVVNLQQERAMGRVAIGLPLLRTETPDLSGVVAQVE